MLGLVLKLQEFQNEAFTNFTKPDERAAFETALANAAKLFGKTHPAWIAGKPVTGRAPLISRDPGEITRVIGTFQQCTSEDAERAVLSAYEAFSAWSAWDAEKRIGLF